MKTNQLAFKLKLSSPLSPKATRAARKMILLLAKEWGFNQQSCREIELCFSEAIHNALEHGSDTEAAVYVTCKVTDRGMTLEIEDRGAGEGNLRALKAAFSTDKESVPDTTNERGRGVFLIRSLMDRSELKITKKGGVRIIMVKARQK